MTGVAADVQTYIESQPEEWRVALVRLRDACREHLPGYVEEIAYGMPSYARAGTVEVSFAKQARYLSLYILKQPVLDAHRAELAHLSVGRGCVRFPRPEQITWDLVVTMLSETAASDDEIC